MQGFSVLVCLGVGLTDLIPMGAKMIPPRRTKVMQKNARKFDFITSWEPSVLRINLILERAVILPPRKTRVNPIRPGRSCAIKSLGGGGESAFAALKSVLFVSG